MATAEVKHHIVVEVDQEHAEAYPTRPAEYVWRVECSSPVDCPAWIECAGDHDGYDPDDESSPAADKFDGVVIHGVAHDWRWGHGWTVDYDGCALALQDLEAPDELYPLQAGRWEVDTEWSDKNCWLSLVTSRTEGLAA